MKIEIGSVAVELVDEGDRIVRHITTTGTPFEPDTLARWVEACRPGSAVIDVGGYSGLFGIAAAKAGAAEVLVVEPLPLMQERIEVNAKANGVGLRLICGAADATCGKAQLCYTNTPFTAGASLKRKSGPNKITVKTVALDCLLVSHPVSAIKIDVERHELAVLAGASKLLARDRPVLFVEVLDDSAEAAVIDMLPSYKVAARAVDRRNLILAPA
jgi:FkbM family methyltransferase